MNLLDEYPTCERCNSETHQWDWIEENIPTHMIYCTKCDWYHIFEEEDEIEV